MNVKTVLKKADVLLPQEEMSSMRREVDAFVKDLKMEVKKNKIDANVFVGGSFAKGTLAREKKYDADIFVRFSDGKEISERLEKILKGLKPAREIKRLHGSRDYFQVAQDERLTFEIIPVKKISRVKDAENVTDLSYFHVRYLKKKIDERKAREIALAKKFLKSAGVYGAESYIRGFSGYGVECLIIYYGTFEKMLRKLVCVEERIVIDMEKQYPKKESIAYEMNESKTQGPIVLIDPTWKERNVLASLSWDTFRKFQKRARMFLEKPSPEFFEISAGEVRSKKGFEIVNLVLKTERQAGDIAGTKMKKFAEMLYSELNERFVIGDKNFSYDGGQEATLVLSAKPKKAGERRGPPITKKEHADAFRKMNPGAFEKKGVLYTKVDAPTSLRDFLEQWIKSGKKRMNEMSISEIIIM